MMINSQLMVKGSSPWINTQSIQDKKWLALLKGRLL